MKLPLSLLALLLAPTFAFADCGGCKEDEDHKDKKDDAQEELILGGKNCKGGDHDHDEDDKEEL